jgi:CRISPR-associated protein Csx16
LEKWLITRHPGAIAWAGSCGVKFDRVCAHLEDVRQIAPGDQVFGSLPVSLAADICARGARYFHLSLKVPHHLRGTELSAADMQQLEADFCEFIITKPEKEPNLQKRHSDCSSLTLPVCFVDK